LHTRAYKVREGKMGLDIRETKACTFVHHAITYDQVTTLEAV
jgi:hypothetical protein